MKTAFVLPLLVFPLAGQEQVQAQTAALDTTTFVVMGEGLAAGMAKTGLSSLVQDKSFPAQMARQMGTAFPRLLMQAPGVGAAGISAGAAPKYPEGTLRILCFTMKGPNVYWRGPL